MHGRFSVSCREWPILRVSSFAPSQNIFLNSVKRFWPCNARTRRDGARYDGTHWKDERWRDGERGRPCDGAECIHMSPGTSPATSKRETRDDGLAASLRGFGPAGILAIAAILLGNALFVPRSALLVHAWARLSRTPWSEIGYV